MYSAQAADPSVSWAINRDFADDDVDGLRGKAERCHGRERRIFIELEGKALGIEGADGDRIARATRARESKNRISNVETQDL